MIAFFRGGWGRRACLVLGLVLIESGALFAAVESALSLEAETKDGWFRVVGAKDQSLLVAKDGRTAPVVRHAKVRIVGDLTANLQFVRVPDLLQIVEEARPSASTAPREWSARVGANATAFAAEGSVSPEQSTGWIRADARPALVVCLWLVDGRIVHTVVRDFAALSSRSHGLEQVSFELKESEIGGTAVLVAFVEGFPIPATAPFADNHRNDAARLAVLGRDAEAAAALGAAGRGATLAPLLTIAVRAGAAATVDGLLKLGAGTVPKSPKAQRALDAAVDASRLEMVKRLLAAGASPKEREPGRPGPLHRAASMGALEICQALVAAGAKPTEAAKIGGTPLDAAVRANRSEVALWLISKGAKLDAKKDYLTAAMPVRAAAGQLPLVKHLRSLGAPADEPVRGETPLIAAAREGHVDVVDYLLAQGALVDRVDREGSTALIVAAGRGRDAVVERLLKAGANVNHVTKRDTTPLLAACYSGSDAAISRLLAAGAAVNPPGPRPSLTLSLALSAGSAKGVADLLAHGAPVETRGQFFESDLQYAFAIDSVEFVAAALAAGMSPERKLPGDWSALEVAELMSAKRCVEALVAAGAPVKGGAKSRLRGVAQLESGPRVAKLEVVRDPRSMSEADFRGETVLVDAVIDETGSARFARAVCQDCRLSRAAAETVMLSRFTPAVAGGWPVATRIQVPIRFVDKSEMSYDLENLDRRPIPTHQVPPTYPFEMKRRGIEGNVRVEFLVTPEGTVREPSVVGSTNEAFEPHAIGAILQWRFEPGIKDGVPVTTRMMIPIGFRLGP